MYICQNIGCGMPLDDTDLQCWICSNFTDFDKEIEYFYLPDHEKPNPQQRIIFPEETIKN